MRRPFLALKPEGASEKNSGGGYKGVVFGDVTLEGLTYSDGRVDHGIECGSTDGNAGLSKKLTGLRPASSIRDHLPIKDGGTHRF